MKAKDVYIVGYTVQGYDMRDDSSFEDFVVKMIPDRTVDIFVHIESEIFKEYRKLGFEVSNLYKEKIISVSPSKLYCCFKNGNFAELEEAK